jgi:hypothetical protein
MRITKETRTGKLGTDRKCGKTGGAAAAALGAWLLVSGPAGCIEGHKAPKKRPALTMKAKSWRKARLRRKPKCGVEWTTEELNSVISELVTKCKGVSQSDILMEGSTVTTISGKVAKVVRVDKGGALWAFGERDLVKGNGKYLVATYIPFESRGYATTFTIMDPALMEGKEREKVKGLNDDVMVVVCPSRDQSKPSEMLKIVKRTWGELRCRIAGIRRREQDQQRLQELTTRIKSIKSELRRTTDLERMGQLGKELTEASKELQQLKNPDVEIKKLSTGSKPGQT